MQWDFERAGHLEIVDMVPAITELRDFGREGGTTAIDDLLVPAGLHEGDENVGRTTRPAIDITDTVERLAQRF